jgi:predicted GIY-YIG superfamily endonuclease
MGNTNNMQWRATADAVRFSNQQFWYVYILRLSNNLLYTGCTSDLNERLGRHEKGHVPATKSHLPVRLIFYCVFNDKYKAYEFEKYLKSGSGRAFLNRHILK